MKKKEIKENICINFCPKGADLSITLYLVLDRDWCKMLIAIGWCIDGVAYSTGATALTGHVKDVGDSSMTCDANWGYILIPVDVYLAYIILSTEPSCSVIDYWHWLDAGPWIDGSHY